MRPTSCGSSVIAFASVTTILLNVVTGFAPNAADDTPKAAAAAMAQVRCLNRISVSPSDHIGRVGEPSDAFPTPLSTPFFDADRYRSRNASGPAISLRDPLPQIYL